MYLINTYSSFWKKDQFIDPINFDKLHNLKELGHLNWIITFRVYVIVFQNSYIICVICMKHEFVGSLLLRLTYLPSRVGIK